MSPVPGWERADLLLHSGIGSVLIANEIVDNSKIRRMINLANLGELIVCVDGTENARCSLTRQAGPPGR